MPENGGPPGLTHRIVPPFDFSAALPLTPEERIDRALETIRVWAADQPHQELILADEPAVAPTGLSEEEIETLEAELGGPLPEEYAHFLRRTRAVRLELSAYELNSEYAWVPNGDFARWLTERHAGHYPWLVIGNYNRYADGDGLMLYTDPACPIVAAYLHEHGPLLEEYAPSFSLALWRFANE